MAGVFDFLLILTLKTHAGFCDISTVHGACIVQGAKKEDPVDEIVAVIGKDFAEGKDRQIEEQAEVLAVLSSLDRTHRFSNKFKMAFAGGNGLAAVEALSKTDGQSEETLRLPLPANSETASMQSVSTEDFKKLFSGLPKSAQDRLREIASKRAPATENHVPEIESKDAIIAKTKEKAERVFSETKANLIDSIRRGRPESALSPEEKSMIRRIETVSLEMPDQNYVQECKDEYNGKYVNTRHHIMMCPSLYAGSESQMAFILGHEIGHSIDPCRASTPLHTDSLGKMFSNGAVWTQLPGAKIYADAIPPNKHPMRNVESCLQQKENIRAVSADDMVAVASVEAIFSRHEENMSDAEFKRYRHDLVKSARTNPVCMENRLLNTEMNEAMSDIYGRVALEAYLRDHPIKSMNEAMAAIPLLPAICGDKDSTEKRNQPRVYSNVHPNRNMRAAYALQIPSLAKALQCTPHPATFCDNEMLAYAAKKPMKPSSVETEASGKQTPGAK